MPSGRCIRSSIHVRADALPEPVTVLAAGADELTYTVISAPFVYAPVDEGDELGELSISCGGREIRRIPLCAAESAEYKTAEVRHKKKLFSGLFSKK